MCFSASFSWWHFVLIGISDIIIPEGSGTYNTVRYDAEDSVPFRADARNNKYHDYYQALGKALQSLLITMLRNVILFIPGVIILNSLFVLFCQFHDKFIYSVCISVFFYKAVL